MNDVSAIIVTRGDVDLKPVLKSLPDEWEVLVYDNGQGSISVRVLESLLARKITGKGELPDLSVYGRYAAIEYASGDLIYVQDDDCVVNDPQAIVQHWKDVALELGEIDRVNTRDHVVCNMPPQFRHDFYAEHSLVGFGACFHRELQERAFQRFITTAKLAHHTPKAEWTELSDFFCRTCDIVFTGLTPRVLVDVPYENLPWASDDTRMWKQPTHQEERRRMLELVLEVRDG